RLARQGHLPLSLVGDGHTATFTDRPRGFVTAHSRASLAELEQAVGAELDERRFRSNIALDGLDAWVEDDLVGHQVRLGSVLFDVVAPIVRCLATHANPDTGLRDAPVMTTLTRSLGRKAPGFGVLMLPAAGGGTTTVGDEVELLDCAAPIELRPRQRRARWPPPSRRPRSDSDPGAHPAAEVAGTGARVPAQVLHAAAHPGSAVGPGPAGCAGLTLCRAHRERHPARQQHRPAEGHVPGERVRAGR